MVETDPEIIERRSFSTIDGADYALDAEVRAEGEDDKPKVSGYAVVFNSYSEDLGGFIEIVREGAGNRALQQGADIRALRDHDSSMLLGRTKSGTLQVTGNKRGLHFAPDLPDVEYARALTTLIKRGDIDGMSFGFRVLRDNWTKKDGQIIRELLDVDVIEGSFVTFPAYRGTSVSVRSIEQAKELLAVQIVVPIELNKLRLRQAQIK